MAAREENVAEHPQGWLDKTASNKTGTALSANAGCPTRDIGL